MKYLKGNNAILQIIALCIISRIPMLTSPNMVLDGDESIVGLMAKHLFEGKELPIYFYGQRYGLTIIEELFILPFYVFLGVTGLAVKLGVLSLWTIGVIFFYKTCEALNKKNVFIPLLLTLLLIICPAWTEWSMKARGGYVTAFTLSAVTTYLLCIERKRGLVFYTLIGLLLVLVYESMSLWMPFLVLLTIYKLAKEFSFSKIVALCASIVLLLVCLRLYKTTLYDFHQFDPILPAGEWLNNVSRIPAFLYHSLHGYHYFFTSYEPGIFQVVFAAIFFIITFFAIALGLVLSVRKKAIDFHLLVFTIPVIGSLLITIVAPYTNFRFLLPVTAAVLLLVQLLLNRLRLSALYMIPACVMIVSGSISLFTFRNFKFTVMNEDNITEVAQYLKSRNIRYVYSQHIYLAWQLIFYSEEDIICRDVSKLGRVPQYHLMIDNALKDGKKTALIGVKDDYFGLDIKDPVFIDLIYIKEDMPIEQLAQNFAIQYTR